MLHAVFYIQDNLPIMKIILSSTTILRVFEYE